MVGFSSPLLRLTKVTWAGGWIVCIVDHHSSTFINMSTTLVLPSQTIPFVVLRVVEPTFHSAPYTITEESLVEEVGPNIGFGVRNFPGAPSRGTINGQLWIKLDAALPKEPFPVIFEYTSNDPDEGTGNGEIFYVATVRGSPTIGGVLEGPDPLNIFPGAEVPDDPDADKIVSVQQATTDTDDFTRTFTFMVDPVSLIVEPATG